MKTSKEQKTIKNINMQTNEDIREKKKSNKELIDDMEKSIRVDALPTEYAHYMPILMIGSALMLIPSIVLNYVCKQTWIEYLPLISTFIDIAIMWVFMQAMKMQTKPMSWLIITYMVLVALKLPGEVCMCFPTGGEVQLYFIFFSIYGSMVLSVVIMFMMSERLISNYGGKLSRLGWVLTGVASVNLIILIVLSIIPIFFNVGRGELYEPTMDAIWNLANLYMNFEIFRILNKKKDE
jgi:hypothetical protein